MMFNKPKEQQEIRIDLYIHSDRPQPDKPPQPHEKIGTLELEKFRAMLDKLARDDDE